MVQRLLLAINTVQIVQVCITGSLIIQHNEIDGRHEQIV